MNFNEVVINGTKYVPAEQATRVSVWGMYDMYLFHKIEGTTVDEIISNWLQHNAESHQATVNGHDVDDLGPSNLCPVIVLSGDKELRRVGRMVFPDRKGIEEYRTALMNDKDVPRLLAARTEVTSEAEAV